MTQAILDAIKGAQLAHRQGRLEDAHRDYAHAASLSRQENEPLLEAHALRHLSDLEREAGRFPDALVHAEAAVALYRPRAATVPLDLSNSLRLAALALESLGRKADAKPFWAEARDGYAATGVKEGVAECTRRLIS